VIRNTEPIEILIHTNNIIIVVKALGDKCESIVQKPQKLGALLSAKTTEAFSIGEYLSIVIYPYSP
jgi:hypothetical protein